MTWTEAEKEVLQKVIDKSIADTNMEVLAKYKTILNRTFGEEFNQIVKPTIEDIIHYMTSLGHNKSGLLDNANYYLKGNRNSYIDNCASYRIVVHFPEIEIKNSKRQSHIIKDLYVGQVILKDGKFANDQLRGVRATLSQKEIASNYSHSHISGHPSDLKSHGWYYGGFCTGSGPINQSISILRSRVSEPDFQLFCLHLKEFVKWESIEGTPYRYINDVIQGTYGGAQRAESLLRVGSHPQQIAPNVLKRVVKKAGFEDVLKVEITENRANVKMTEELEQFIGSTVETENPQAITISGNHRNYQIMCTKDKTGAYWQYGANSGNRYNITNDRKTPLFTFKNKEIPLTIEKDETETKQTIYVNPAITEEICSILSGKLTDELYSYQGEAEVSTTKDLKEAPSPVPVPL